MARSEARILVEIWDDDDFLELSPLAQRMYLFLISQRDLEHTGVLGLRERRWAKGSTRLTMQAVTEQLAELQAANYVVVDEDTEELLVRSFIRRDKVFRQPNVMRSAKDHIPLIKSQRIRDALAVELQRIVAEEEMSDGAAEVLAGMLTDLLKGTAKGSRKGSTDPTEEGTAESSAKGMQVPLGERGVVTAVSSDSPFPFPLSPSTTVAPTAATDPGPKPSEREDVERICQRLAKWVVHNGSRPPTVGDRWRKEARLLIDKDKRPLAEIVRILDWCQKDPFWKGNILSMPTFREKYDQLRLAAQRSAGQPPGRKSGSAPTPSNGRPSRYADVEASATRSSDCEVAP